MSELLIAERQDLLNIANAIREKLGTANQMSLANMPSLIRTIETGSVSGGTGGSSSGTGSSGVDQSLIKINPRIVAEFNGTLRNMITNEAYPSTQYFGTNFSGIKLTYGKYYLVEYNGTSYLIRPGFTPLLSLAGTGMGGLLGSSPTDFLTLGSTTMLDEMIKRQNAEPPEEGEEEDSLAGLGWLLAIIMAAVLGQPIDFDSIDMTQYPFTFVSFADYEGVVTDGQGADSIFIVNNGEPECSLKITEYNIEIEDKLAKHLQPDYMQFDKSHPAYIKNKLIGIESTDKLFFDGKVGDLTLTPITDDEGDTKGYIAPLNEIPMGLEFMGALFGDIFSGGGAVDSMASMFMSLLTERCVIIKYNGVEQVLYPMDMKSLFGFDESYFENMTEEELAEFESAFMGEDGSFEYPFGNAYLLHKSLPNTGENFCVTVSFVYDTENEEAVTETIAEVSNEEGSSEETDISMDKLSRLVVLKGTAYTNLTVALPEHEIRAEYAKIQVLDKRYLPIMEESDLPVEALTYTTSKDNVMLRDQENGFEYLVLCKNGVLETLCRCESIAVTTNPNKMSYKVGDNFDPTGMVVTATRQDGSTEDITSKVSCDYTSSTFSSADDEKEITVTFREAGHSYTATVTVVVTE